MLVADGDVCGVDALVRFCVCVLVQFCTCVMKLAVNVCCEYEGFVMLRLFQVFVLKIGPGLDVKLCYCVVVFVSFPDFFVSRCCLCVILIYVDDLG